MNPETMNTILLGFLSLGQLATFVVILRLGIQYGRDSTTLATVQKDVGELKPVVAGHTDSLGQHHWRLKHHDDRLNKNEADVEGLRKQWEDL